MADLNQHNVAVHEIAKKVDRLTKDTNIRVRFTKQIDQFCKMVEDYGQALQPYAEQLEKAKWCGKKANHKSH